MEPEQIMLVQESWEEVLQIADKAAELFYEKLFEINAEEQGRKLMTTLNLVVRGLSKPGALAPFLEGVGSPQSEIRRTERALRHRRRCTSVDTGAGSGRRLHRRDKGERVDRGLRADVRCDEGGRCIGKR